MDYVETYVDKPSDVDKNSTNGQAGSIVINCGHPARGAKCGHSARANMIRQLASRMSKTSVRRL
jgi:hypothetical protein